MRRHAEGLIILSGSTPGRGWRDPVPVVDVLRAAIAEVEDYVRVDVLSESRDLVAGNAVNDIIHLVAELVENATAFSPPNTRIEVRADRVGTGLVAEIEDRGLGLSQDELADINGRLANPPEFDLANSEQLGLFIVSRLAVRHAIKVSLRQSVYGGTTAILVLPFGVIVREEEADARAACARRRLVRRRGPSDRGRAGPRPLPSFGVTGRHRLSAAVAGRRGRYRRDGPRRGRPASGAGPLPRAPWEFAQPEPQATGGPAAGSRRAAAVGRRDGRRRPGSMPSAVPRPSGAPEPAGRGSARRRAGARSGQQAAAGASPGSHLGMPIRVPQASLAPQLRASRGQRPAGDGKRGA